MPGSISGPGSVGQATAVNAWSGKPGFYNPTDAYATLVKANGAAAHWRANDPVGNPVLWDVLGGWQAATVNGPTFGQTSLLSTITDTAVLFTAASSQYALTGTSWPNELLTSWSVEAWFKATGAGTITIITHKQDLSAANAGWAIYLNAGTANFRVSDGTTQRTATSAGTYNNGLPHHVVATYSVANGLILYVDNVSVATGAAVGSLNPAAVGVAIGASFGTSNPFDGTLDELAFYPFELSAAQVTADFVAGGGSPSSPQTVTLGLIDQTAVIFAPTVTPGAVTITLGFLNQTATIAAPIVGPPGILPALINQTAVIFAPTLTTGPVTVTLGLIDRTAVISAPSLSLSFGLPIISNGATIAAPVITTLTTVTLGFINRTATIAAPQLNLAFALPFIDRTAAPFAPQVNLSFALPLINQGSSTFAPTVANAGGGTQTVTLGLTDQTAVIFALTVTPGAVTVALGLIDRTATIAAPIVGPPGVVLGLINQAAATFSPTISVGGVTVTLPLITQTASPFAPVITSSVTVTLGLITRTASAFAPTISQSSGQNVTLGVITVGAHVFAITLHGGGRTKRGLYPLLLEELAEERKQQPLVVAHSLMDSLVGQYGREQGEEIYFRMERERRGPFAEGNKYGRSHLGTASPVRGIPDTTLVADYIKRQREKAGK